MEEIASNIIWLQNEIVQIDAKLKILYLDKELIESRLRKSHQDMASAIPSDNKTYYLPSVRTIVSKNALGMVRVLEVEILD